MICDAGVRDVPEVQKLQAWEGLGMVAGLTLAACPRILTLLHARPTPMGSGALRANIAGQNTRTASECWVCVQK